MSQSYNVLELFCGCGGLSYGLTEAKLNVVCGIDICDKAISNYSKNFPNHLALCKDLTVFPPNECAKLLNCKIDIIAGGAPCQGFSNAGKRDSKDPRNSLFMEFVKYLDYFNPKAFIFENVIGILSMKTELGENVIDIILNYFNKNYNTIVCKLYASDFEVPQNRRRVIIFGIHKSLNINPTEPPLISADNRISVSTVLESKDTIDPKLYLSDKAIQGIINRATKAKLNGNGFGAQFLDLTKPSFTIPARYWKDGYDALVKYSDTCIRRLSILELKRIQSFPDDYILEGSKKDVIMQIGNAVPCKFAYHLGRHLLSMLNTK